MSIREINPESEVEITLVALRMRHTLIEVLGEEKGTALYTLDWLRERVLWHLDPDKSAGKVFLSVVDQGQITGHAIARIEQDESGADYGMFSTVFVAPEFRRMGLAKALMAHVENWFISRKMLKVVYNTATNHVKILSLFQSHGYRITHTEADMVQLTKQLPAHIH